MLPPPEEEQVLFACFDGRTVLLVLFDFLSNRFELYPLASMSHPEITSWLVFGKVWPILLLQLSLPLPMSQSLGLLFVGLGTANNLRCCHFQIATDMYGLARGEKTWADEEGTRKHGRQHCL